MSDEVNTGPPGWPRGVPPPGAPGWQEAATQWLLDQCPSDFRAYDAWRRHPVALAWVATWHVDAQLGAMRESYRRIRVDLADELPPRAVPQVMAFSEVYQAMQTGVVDGSENTPSNVFTQKMHEVQKHATHSNHGYIGYAVIVNKAFWDGLPEDIRAELDKAMDEATTYANGVSEADNAAALTCCTRIDQVSDGDRT